MRYLLLIIFAGLTLIFYSQTTDASGKKQGYWKKKDEKTNKLIYEGEFKDDKPVGKFKYYYPTDSLQAIMNFREGGKIAYAKLFGYSGKRMAEGKYINEIKDSVWVYYDDGGVMVSREKYVNGKKEGPSIVYLPDGSKAEERNFKNGVEDGEFKQYFDGKKLKGQGKYVNGKMEGRVVYYYPDGIEVAAGFYVNGEKNGPWIYKDKKGKVTEKELYKNGVLASKKETEAFFNKNKTPETPAKNTPQKQVKKPSK